MLYYLPLEGYKERYTHQWSAPKTGWLERNWIKAGIEYTRVDGDMLPAREIKVGCVLDAVGRSTWCFSQVSRLLSLLEEGKLTSDDVIYFDDFWHPGIEALPYAFHLFDVSPKMYAFLHAQSVDEFDFTHPMRHWMRHFEKGIAEALEGIFVCGPCLQDLVVFGGIAPREKVHVTGHPFSGEEVMERMPEWYRTGYKTDTIKHRFNQVVYSSRWDREKNPDFFLAVAEEVIKHNPLAKFIVCTGSKRIRSNDPSLIALLKQCCQRYPTNIILKEDLKKEQYYEHLCFSKVQMNTASQDFVAITLLEASVAGCYPVYPYFRSFPETLRYSPDYMYQRGDVLHAANKVLSVLSRDDLWTKEEIDRRSWIHTRFDTAWLRMLRVMGLMGGVNDDPYQV